MKRDVLKYGLLSGLAIALCLALTVPFQKHTSASWSMVVTYTTMVLSFLIVFVGVKHYRDTDRNGSITFGRALAVGTLMMLLSCACYVAMWEVLLLTVEKNFAHDYTASLVHQAQQSGLQGAALDRRIADARKFETTYNNPLYSAAITLLEPLPVGLIMALVTAGILRRKPRDGPETTATSQALAHR